MTIILTGCKKDHVFEEGVMFGYINGYVYADLGLSVKWATCNVGANSPEEYGSYFAWGETETKKEYYSSNSVTYGLSISELKSQGIIDGDHNLTPSHDAATANWGGTWRLPTKAELEELEHRCTWEWTTQNGVKGCRVTGPNGNNIFLPAAGFRDGSSLTFDGSLGGYWSSTRYVNNYNGNAYYLRFHGGGENVDYYNRYNGLTVRPITE